MSMIVSGMCSKAISAPDFIWWEQSIYLNPRNFFGTMEVTCLDIFSMLERINEN